MLRLKEQKRERDPRELMRPEEDSSLKVTGLLKLAGSENQCRWNMAGREHCARCNKIHNVNPVNVNDGAGDDDAFHIGNNSAMKGHKCVVDTVFLFFDLNLN